MVHYVFSTLVSLMLLFKHKKIDLQGYNAQSRIHSKGRIHFPRTTKQMACLDYNFFFPDHLNNLQGNRKKSWWFF